MNELDALKKELADKDQFIENVLSELKSVYALLTELKQALKLIAGETSQLTEELKNVDRTVL